MRLFAAITGLSTDMTTRGLRVGDVAGVGGAICDEFCNTVVGSGRGRKRERENMVAVEPKSEAEAPTTGLSSASSVALFLRSSLLLIQYRPVFCFHWMSLSTLAARKHSVKTRRPSRCHGDKWTASISSPILLCSR